MKNLFDDTFLGADGVTILELVLGKVDIWGWTPALNLVDRALQLCFPRHLSATWVCSEENWVQGQVNRQIRALFQLLFPLLVTTPDNYSRL